MAEVAVAPDGERGGADAARPLIGISLKISATFVFTLMAIVGRSLGDAIPVGEVVFFRAAFAFVPLLAWMAFRRIPLSSLRTAYPLLHARRATTGVLAMFTYFSALVYLPVADLTAIGFASPLIVVILAALVLGETVRIYRWSAVATGFIGVLIMLLPHLSGEIQSGWGVMFALANAVLVAFTMIFIRSMSHTEPALTIAFYFQLSSAVIGALTLLFAWVTPNPSQLLALIALGVLGGIGQLLMTTSYRHAPASTLASFEYAAMIWAVLLGWLVFGEAPATEVYIGAAIVFASGVFIAWREQRRGRDVLEPSDTM